MKETSSPVNCQFLMPVLRKRYKDKVGRIYYGQNPTLAQAAIHCTPPELCPQQDNMDFSLPPELVSIILEYISHDDLHLAKHATISRHWQAIIESKTFSSLKINTPKRLAEFNELSWDRRRSYVPKVDLIIQLESYYDDDDACTRYENEGEMQRNNKIFTTSIHSLFITLAKWPAKEEAEFSLSIEARSPDDLLGQTPEAKREREKRIEESYPSDDLQDKRFERSYLQFNAEVVGVKCSAVPTITSLGIMGAINRSKIEPASCSFIVSKFPRLYRLVLYLNNSCKWDPGLRKRHRNGMLHNNAR